MEFAYKTIHANLLNFNVAFAGPATGEPVVLLHGFPDASFGWEKQIKALADAGFFVIVPDQRGYNLSDKPRGKKLYQMKYLVEDILALADALGLEKFNLVGHDFGAMVSWHLVDKYPDRVKRLAILNVPHPRVMNEFLAVNKEQRRRSWYAFFFRLPRLPEIAVRLGNWKMLAAAMDKGLSDVELDRYRTAWAQPGAMTAMINWYRCMFQYPQHTGLVESITVPTLMIWGKQDPHLMWQMAPGSIEICTDGRLVYVEDAAHWVHQEKPEIVNPLLVEHFREETKVISGNESSSG